MSAMKTAKNRLGEALAAGRFTVTAECEAPAGADAGAIRKRASLLPPGLDAVIVPDNHNAIRCSALACAALLAAEGHTAVLSMVTRDRNRIALQSDVLGAAALGVSGILSLSGDHQWLGACPKAAGVYDIDSIQFAQALNTLRREGVGLDGHKLEPPPQLLIGAVTHPALQPAELALLRLRKKVAAGVDFLVTDAVKDLSAFAAWMEAARGEGLDRGVAIIAGIDARGGAATAARLKTIPGVRGIHILSGGCEELAAPVIREAGLA